LDNQDKSSESVKTVKRILLPQRITISELSLHLKIPQKVLGPIASDIVPGGIPSNKWNSALLNKNQIEMLCAGAEVSYDFESPERVTRSPIITVMGHVDHGKTTLIDTLRHSNIAGGEYGAITQSIGAFSLEMNENEYATVIDTPGHEIFKEMRTRGILATDIIILVVSSVDGVQRQTKEVIHLIRDSNVPIIVAINKIDRSDADIDQVVLELAEHDIIVELLGGTIPSVAISAKKGQNIDKLLKVLKEKISTLDLRESNKVRAQGFVIESEMVKNKSSIGIASSVVVIRGTLASNDYFISDQTMGRIKYIRDDTKSFVRKIEGGKAAHISGFKEALTPGNLLYVVENERQARIIQVIKKKFKNSKALEPDTTEENRNFDTIEDGVLILIKASKAGILEIIEKNIREKFRRNCIQIMSKEIGPITKADIKAMVAVKGLIFGFDVDCKEDASADAKTYGVPIRIHKLMLQLMENLENLENEVNLRKGNLYNDVMVGRATVKKLFSLSGNTVIAAGCQVTLGSISKERKCKVIRNKEVVKENLEIAGLKVASIKVDSISEGLECGITLKGYNDFEVGDIIESYTQVKRLSTFSFAPGVKYCD